MPVQQSMETTLDCPRTTRNEKLGGDPSLTPTAPHGEHVAANPATAATARRAE